MLARIDDAAGGLVAVHRTYLARDGSAKAKVEPQKASLGPVAGGAIRIHPLAAELVIAEGIETAASAGRMLSLPAWAAVSAGNLARTLALPSEVRAIVIAADNDPPDERGHRRGQDAAQAAAARWQAEGRRVRIATPTVEGSDFNDLIRAAGRA
jgi:putative DNA primase/helicase